MTAIAEFTLQPMDFPLGRLFEGRPGARFELDRVVPSGDTVMPYFWVHDPGGEMAAAQAVLDGLPEVRSVRLMEDLGERGLFRAEWKPEYMDIMSAIAASEVTVVSATGSEEEWAFELRAESAERFSAFTRFCDEEGVNVTLTRLSQLTDANDDGAYGLTPEQREALVLAFEEGYYDEPRRTDLEALAGRLGITRPAFSARLRRGYRNLVESLLVHGGESGRRHS